MSLSQEQIIEAIRSDPFTSKDYSKDVLITIDGIVNLFPGGNKDDILQSIKHSTKEIRYNPFSGEVVISKDLFN